MTSIKMNMAEKVIYSIIKQHHCMSGIVHMKVSMMKREGEGVAWAILYRDVFGQLTISLWTIEDGIAGIFEFDSMTLYNFLKYGDASQFKTIEIEKKAEI